MRSIDRDLNRTTPANSRTSYGGQWLPIEEGEPLYWFDVKHLMGSYQTLYTTDKDKAYEMLVNRGYKVIGIGPCEI